MELKAELVVKDCAHALSKYDQTLQGVELRLSWWNIISLLRAVGHVLDKVDSKASLRHAQIIKQEFQTLKESKPEPAIFWLFIDSERNRFLKEYDHSIRRQVSENPPLGKAGFKVSVHLDNIVGPPIGYSGDNLYIESFIKEGPYKDRNELEVAKEAKDWWVSYLEKIKRKVEEDR